MPLFVNSFCFYLHNIWNLTLFGKYSSCVCFTRKVGFYQKLIMLSKCDDTIPVWFFFKREKYPPVFSVHFGWTFPQDNKWSCLSGLYYSPERQTYLWSSRSTCFYIQSPRFNNSDIIVSFSCFGYLISQSSSSESILPTSRCFCAVLSDKCPNDDFSSDDRYLPR